MSYSYSPELKAPQKMPDIDPGKAAMAGMLKILCLTHQKQTAAFRPPEGLRCRKISAPAADGSEIPCFVIEPEGTEKELPGVLMIHGGGFYLPVQTSALALGCEYARGLNARVFLPEYRLVPQFTAPTQLQDCMATWKAMPDLGADPSRMLVIGDSAGAALAAGLCIRLRDEGKPLPKGQLLIYPVLDNRVNRYASYERYADACWSSKATEAMWEAYLKGMNEGLSACLIPARCDDLSNLPAAYIEPQEFDVLRDEAEAFFQALQEAGVPSQLNIVKGSYHGFDSDLSSPLVQRIIRQRISAADRMLH